jgi:hypothetical protein
MPRRLTPAQYQAEVRKQQRAIEEYNRKARQHNAQVVRDINDYNRRAEAHNAKVLADERKRQREIDDYNRKAQAHNERTVRAVNEHNRQVRAHRQRLAQEVARLESISRRSSTPYESSVHSLRTSFRRLEESIESRPGLNEELVELSEGETANSVAALNAMLAGSAPVEATDDEVAELQRTSIGNELAEVDPDLDARWRGALYALSPRNPDAARHFCTSAREMLSRLLETAAPDSVVVDADPNCLRTPEGKVSRRARIQYCLRRSGSYDAALEDFVEQDIDNVLALFSEFNAGTHGGAGRFGLAQLRAIKSRVEDAIRFVHRILS